MNNERIKFPLLDNLMLIMGVFVVGGILAIGVWKLIELVYGHIENPMGAVIRLGMTAVFSILVWRIIFRKTGAKNV